MSEEIKKDIDELWNDIHHKGKLNKKILEKTKLILKNTLIQVRKILKFYLYGF